MIFELHYWNNVLIRFIREEEDRKRLAEWEAKRKEQLLAHRQTEEDKLVQLKEKQKKLSNDLEGMVRR